MFLILGIVLNFTFVCATDNAAAQNRTYFPTHTHSLKELLCTSYHYHAHNHDRLLLLLDQRADPRVTDDSTQRSVLHVASRADDLSVVEAALNKGAYVDAVDNEGNTSLMSTGSARVLRCLLTYKADPKKINKAKQNALHTAARINGSVEVLALLCNAGTQVNQQDHFLSSPLHTLFESASYNPVREGTVLLHTGANSQLLDMNQHTPVDIFQRKFPCLVRDLEKIIAAEPKVKQEREAHKTYVDSILGKGPGRVVAEYAFPVWDKELCPSLFEQHSGVPMRNLAIAQLRREPLSVHSPAPGHSTAYRTTSGNGCAVS